jgi:2-dehydro-3-deoxygalactonokinase
MSVAAFIAVDWGTSNARFALCDAAGSALESRQGPGAVESRGRFAQVFDEHTAGWRQASPQLPAYLCGMAGSAIGWREAPYLPCPAELNEIAAAPLAVRDGVFVVPGMRCTNPLGAPDVMRGEETQLLGAREMHASLAHGHSLACMPGTHTKWVSLFDGVVEEFLTAPTGELFSMLCDHSVLVRDRTTPVTHVAGDFERGLAEAAKHPGTLLHQLFQARSLRLDGQLAAQGTASWVSGLLIGADVAGALSFFNRYPAHAPIHVVGAPRLTSLYCAALARHGRTAVEVAGEDAALRGLSFVHEVHRGARV